MSPLGSSYRPPGLRRLSFHMISCPPCGLFSFDLHTIRGRPYRRLAGRFSFRPRRRRAQCAGEHSIFAYHWSIQCGSPTTLIASLLVGPNIHPRPVSAPRQTSAATEKRTHDLALALRGDEEKGKLFEVGSGWDCAFRGGRGAAQLALQRTVRKSNWGLRITRAVLPPRSSLCGG
jgi:hypothetical protein